MPAPVERRHTLGSARLRGVAVVDRVRHRCAKRVCRGWPDQLVSRDETERNAPLRPSGPPALGSPQPGLVHIHVPDPDLRRQLAWHELADEGLEVARLAGPECEAVVHGQLERRGLVAMPGDVGGGAGGHGDFLAEAGQAPVLEGGHDEGRVVGTRVESARA